MALQRLIFSKITLERQSRQRERKAPTAESKRVIKRMLQLYLTAVLRRNRRRSHAPPAGLAFARDAALACFMREVRRSGPNLLAGRSEA
jgi:hypothetical protein